MQPVFEDTRLEAIRAKVAAGERLSYQDGLTIYRTPDLLGVGWLANQVRERLHGNQTYFNVNRHINPTDVCVASCKLCAFGKQKRDPKAYTMSLEEVWHKAGRRLQRSGHRIPHRGRPASRADARLVLPDAARPEAALPAGAPEGLHHGRDRLFRAARQDQRARSAGAPERRRHGFDARRRRGNLSRSRAAHHLRSQAHRPAVDRYRPHRAPDGPALQLHHALRPHRDRRRPPGSSAPAARAAG